MAMNFVVYESTITTLGTVKELAGTKGSLKFTTKTINNPKAQLCVVFQRADGTSATAVCSKAVTAGIRSALEKGITKKKCLASLQGLSVVEAPNGGNYISAPAGAMGESFTIEELSTEMVNYEDLVAI